MKRVQQKRGKKLPPNTKSVARPSRWGNPYKVQPHGPFTAAESVRLYRQHVTDHPELITSAIKELSGHDLACYCSPNSPCHADVLIELIAERKAVAT